MKALKKNVSISLDPEVIETIRLYAEESDRSFSQYINLAENTQYYYQVLKNGNWTQAEKYSTK